MKKTRRQKSVWSQDLIPSLEGKTIIVTGANSGVGYEASRIFVQNGARVVMACRDEQKAKEAVHNIKQTVPYAKVEYMLLDLASLTSVREFAQLALQKLSNIDILCNNAGVMTIPYKNYTTTKDGFEMHFGINHLGHFALTGLLFERIVCSKDARIVTVSSAAHKIGSPQINFDDLNATKNFKNQYGVSKLANLLFTYEMDRRLKQLCIDNVKAIACHPGIAKSNLLEAGPKMAKSKTSLWIKLAYINAQTAEKGGFSEVYAASGLDINGGDYIGPDGFQEAKGLPTKVQSNSISHDIQIANRLWTVSEQMTGVHFL